MKAASAASTMVRRVFGGGAPRPPGPPRRGGLTGEDLAGMIMTPIKSHSTKVPQGRRGLMAGNAATARRLWEEIFTAMDLNAVGEVGAPDGVEHTARPGEPQG